MSDLPKAYVAKDHESQIYDLWQKNNAFAPSKEGEPFSILMPPPNANEGLHVGHALFITVEDIMTRFARMQGKKTSWIPGTDHAGFETQVVFEKKLQKEGKSRFDFTPEELRKQIHQYVTEQQERILSQIKMMGASCDWDKLYFTLDTDIVETVYQTFSKMHDDKLLYRAKRLVNYCVKHQTSFSDLEVEYEDQVGQLVYIKYPIKDAPGEFITVATTRPETLLGDSGVAVNLDNKDYHRFIGNNAILPLVGRLIPIVSHVLIDTKMGTGAVKVTPAHSFVDNVIAQDNHLESYEVIDQHGKIIARDDIPHELHGLKISDARQKIVELLRKEGLIEKIEEHPHRVGVCYKCRTPIEILPIEQWWVNTKPLAERAIEALESGKITITPAEYKNHLIKWFEDIIDWNISRQTVWGIPIPAWYRKRESGITNIASQSAGAMQESRETEGKSQSLNSKFVIRNSQNDNEEIKIQLESPGEGWVQDKDTFDTWFSSSQLPYAALGYPGAQDFKTFFPTSVMETARDILYFWVGRMIMMSLYVTDEVPFKHIYLHGLVMDAHGRKMSKSKGNVVDPIAIMEQYGTDALRWGLINGTSAGQNFNMTLDRVIGGRNLANKLWNASRFVLLALEGSNNVITPSVVIPANAGIHKENGSRVKPGMTSEANQIILVELEGLAAQVTKFISEDQFSLASDLLFDFFWHRFCDQYLEESKKLTSDPETAKETKEVLIYSLTKLLKMFHPFMPFVTETIWQELKTRGLVNESLLITSTWPK